MRNSNRSFSGCSGKLRARLVTLFSAFVLLSALSARARVDVLVHVVLRLEADGPHAFSLSSASRAKSVARYSIAPANGGRMDVDEVVDRHATIDKTLDLVLAVRFST